MQQTSITTNASAATTAQDDVKFIAISKFGWGSSSDKSKAVKNCKANAPHGKRSGEIKIYRASSKTIMFGDGSWEYPVGKKPELIETI